MTDMPNSICSRVSIHLRRDALPEVSVSQHHDFADLSWLSVDFRAQSCDGALIVHGTPTQLLDVAEHIAARVREQTNVPARDVTSEEAGAVIDRERALHGRQS